MSDTANDEETQLFEQCTTLAAEIFGLKAYAYVRYGNGFWHAAVRYDGCDEGLRECGKDRVTALMGLRLALFGEAHRTLLQSHKFAREHTQRADALLAAANAIDNDWEAKASKWSPLVQKF